MTSDATAEEPSPSPAAGDEAGDVASPAGASRWRGRAGVALLVGVAALAVVETAQALIAPTRAPSTADWSAAEQVVRAGFHPGDLIVAAPAWADPILRMHLGDLIPIPVATRMDDARYGRVWEVSERGAHAPEAWSASGPRGKLALEQRAGRLTVRLVERPAATVVTDFLEAWQRALVFRWDFASQTRTPCAWQADRIACGGGAGGSVHRELVEVDNRIRDALLAPPVAGAVLAIEFPAVILGRSLVVAAGLHDTWQRKVATGTVDLEVFVAGARRGRLILGTRSGWSTLAIDTTAFDGRPADVRFELSSSTPAHLLAAFAGEARR